MSSAQPAPNGPGKPFQLLFSDDPPMAPSLPEAFRAVYGGDWHIPQFDGKPYLYTNFATSRDGRVSYNEPGKSTGGDVTGFDPHDRWLMGLLRARADCVMMGEGTVNAEKDHVWTAEFICDYDAESFATLRKAEGLAPVPLFIIVTQECILDDKPAVFHRPDVNILIATTEGGIRRAERIRAQGRLDVRVLGRDSVNLHKLVDMAYAEFGVRRLLCEGGPRLMANLLASGLVDEEFVTLCPAIIGRTQDRFRPSYVEGVAFTPDHHPHSRPHALRRAGDFLYMQTRCAYS